jgi:hypothetical protein
MAAGHSIVLEQAVEHAIPAPKMPIPRIPVPHIPDIELGIPGVFCKRAVSVDTKRNFQICQEQNCPYANILGKPYLEGCSYQPFGDCFICKISAYQEKVYMSRKS